MLMICRYLNILNILCAPCTVSNHRMRYLFSSTLFPGGRNVKENIETMLLFIADFLQNILLLQSTLMSRSEKVTLCPSFLYSHLSSDTMFRVSLKTTYVVPKADTMHHAKSSLRMILFDIFKLILNQSFKIKTSIIVIIIIVYTSKRTSSY